MSKIAYVEPIGAAEICKVCACICMANGVDEAIEMKFILVLELDVLVELQLFIELEDLFVLALFKSFSIDLKYVYQ